MTDFERVALDVFDSTVRPFLTGKLLIRAARVSSSSSDPVADSRQRCHRPHSAGPSYLVQMTSSLARTISSSRLYVLASAVSKTRAEASAQPSQSMKGLFGPNGALYDGWESRRHNPAFDWSACMRVRAFHRADPGDAGSSSYSPRLSPISTTSI